MLQAHKNNLKYSLHGQLIDLLLFFNLYVCQTELNRAALAASFTLLFIGRFDGNIGNVFDDGAIDVDLLESVLTDYRKKRMGLTSSQLNIPVLRIQF